MLELNADKVETILSEDGALMLEDLPFHIGDAVEVIIWGRSPSQAEAEKAEDQPEPNLYPLRGTVLFYEDPFESATPAEDWEVLR
jgi:hypothetical protein